MKTKYPMLDTNICAYILRDRPRDFKKHLNRYPELWLSSVVYAELKYGIQLSPEKLKEDRRKQLDLFLRHFKIVAFEESAADHYAEIRADLKIKGELIGNMDMLIAAHARSLNTVLVTNNEREFRRVKHLKVENWMN